MRIKSALLSACIFCSTVSSMLGQSITFQRIYDTSLAQASYIIANEDKQAIVIDPKRDIDTYLNWAKDNDMQIIYVTETHIHADFLSGSRELAKATGAELALSALGGSDWQYEFDHTPLKDKDIITLGNLQVKVMHTPGHTPESITFLVTDKNRPEEPIKAITGDFVFVSDVGRPDLLEKAAGIKGSQEKGALELFESLNEFVKLPKDTQIWPGHGAGSFCGKSLSNIPGSTLEIEMQNSTPFSLLNDQKAFMEYILEGQPQAPMYFKEMKRLNKIVRPLQIEVPKTPMLSQQEFLRAVNRNLLVIDTRDRKVVEKGFIPGSLHIANSDSFSTYVGSLVDYTPQIVLIGQSEDIADITRKLMRIGMDNIYGYIPEVDSELTLEKVDLIEANQIKDYQNKDNVQLIDVRSKQEYDSGHIKGFENIALNDLQQSGEKISKDKTIVIHCQSGARAAIAYSVLKKMGYNNVVNYSGGINNWKAKGMPLEK